METQKIIVFLDQIQRTVVATLVSETDTKLTVSKPAILQTQPTQDKKLQVQLYPLMFREFFKNRDEFPLWVYDKSSVTITENLELEPNLTNQYTEMFKVIKNDPAPTIKLFGVDDEPSVATK